MNYNSLSSTNRSFEEAWFEFIRSDGHLISLLDVLLVRLDIF